MTAPEAESGPGDNSGIEVPGGWVVHDDGIATLDTLHPRFPDRVDRIEPKIRAALEADRELNAAIDRLIDDHLPPDEVTEAAEAGDPAAVEQWVAALDAMIEAAEDLAVNMGGGALAGETFWRYTLERIFRLQAATHAEVEPIARLIGRLHPVVLVANLGDGVVAVEVGPREIAMCFGGASPSDRDAYGDLIRDMQRAMGYPTSKAGRPRNEERSVAREQARVAARLAYWAGFTEAEIAELFDWATEATAKQRIRDGSAALAETIDPDWKVAVPPRLRQRQAAMRERARRGNFPD